MLVGVSVRDPIKEIMESSLKECDKGLLISLVQNFQACFVRQTNEIKSLKSHAQDNGRKHQEMFDWMTSDKDEVDGQKTLKGNIKTTIKAEFCHTKRVFAAGVVAAAAFIGVVLGVIEKLKTMGVL